ncbi:tyrosine phosphatase family protein [Chelatococcus reniformis]|uniref:Protein-tyrosine-phosphatase n=1 Tax=Chelatococcus reniformis TaxID=1494448 RepID=A0A916U6R6_9HYPH|nr:protein tyrosine phosphatase [Chelatococcus reniformis]GGC61907.1 protein-tyrosine-phosphatase [Chelatococcus reniformis]
MPTLHVCSLSRVGETTALLGATHLVTLLNAGGVAVTRPAAIAADCHLNLAVSDIVSAQPGHVLPGAAHVEALLDFVRRWDRGRPLLIHCYAGVSRSTAAAFISACALAPAIDEADLAWRLREASPTATPNAALVAAADVLLGRNGRMVNAVAAIGRGADAFEGEPFELRYI